MSMSVPPSPASSVAPLPQEGGDLPHGLKDLIPYGFSWEELWPKLLIVLAAVLVCAVLYGLWRKFRKKKVESAIPEDPFLVLERKLAKMEPPEPFEGKKAVQYVFDLNMTFRQFIELCSGVPATDLTLQELKEPLRLKSHLSRDVTEDVIKFLERTEYIKFAGRAPEIREARESHLQVKQWVSYLRPRHIEQKEIQNS